MSRALSAFHGPFGRATLYALDRPLIKHAHREAHLLFFLGGAPGAITVRDDPIALDDSIAVAVNPWEEHGFSPLRRLGAGHYLIFYFNPQWLRKTMPSPGPRHRLFEAARVPLLPAMRVLRDDICQALLNGGVLPLVFEQLLVALVKNLHALPRSGREMPPISEDDGNWAHLDFRLRKSMTALSPTLPLSVNLGGIARNAGLSRAHFFKLFRDQIGLTPAIYMNALRIETALQGIALSDASVTDISDQLGFSCQSAFSRFFSAHVGMAPTDYRRAVQILGLPLHA